MPRSRGGLIGFSEENHLNENILALDRLSQLALKSKNFQLHQRCDVALLDLKSGRAQYEKGQKRGESSQGNEINPLVGRSIGSEVSIYHY